MSLGIRLPERTIVRRSPKTPLPCPELGIIHRIVLRQAAHLRPLTPSTLRDRLQMQVTLFSRCSVDDVRAHLHRLESGGYIIRDPHTSSLVYKITPLGHQVLGA